MGLPDWFERQTYEAEFGEEGAFSGYGRTAFSPDGKTLASVVEIRGDWADDSIVFADAATLAKKNVFHAQGHITDLAWTPDGSQIEIGTIGREGMSAFPLLMGAVAPTTGFPATLPFGVNLSALSSRLTSSLWS